MPTTARTTVAAELAHYGAMVDLHDHLPINVHLSPAQEETMISLLGPPVPPLTINDQPDHASALVRKLRVDRTILSHFRVSGIRPAVDSLADALGKAVAHEKAAGHDLDGVLASAGMLVVRLRRPTVGPPSTKASNHSWGTAVDFKLFGGSPPANTGGKIPTFIAVLLPFMNAAGWFSGIAFSDTMHFEVADETIRQWAAAGKLKP